MDQCRFFEFRNYARRVARNANGKCAKIETKRVDNGVVHDGIQQLFDIANGIGRVCRIRTYSGDTYWNVDIFIITIGE